MPFIHNGVQLSPCIVAKAKIALGLSNIRIRINNKRCTAYYWRKVVRAVAARYNVPSNIMDNAIDDYEVYCS
jgi:hypothetical protein